MKELEKDMGGLRNGMKEVEREIEFFRTSQRAAANSSSSSSNGAVVTTNGGSPNQGKSDGDRYLPVMKEFSAKTAVRLAELEDLFVDMKARVISVISPIYFLLKSKLKFQFDRVCRLFCEDPATTQSDEFFGVFDSFVVALLEAKLENEAVRRRKEEEEKMAKQQQELRWVKQVVLKVEKCVYLLTSI